MNVKVPFSSTGCDFTFSRASRLRRETRCLDQALNLVLHDFVGSIDPPVLPTVCPRMPPAGRTQPMWTLFRTVVTSAELSSTIYSAAASGKFLNPSMPHFPRV